MVFLEDSIKSSKFNAIIAIFRIKVVKRSLMIVFEIVRMILLAIIARKRYH